MTADKQIIDGKECKYWFRPNPTDYRKCSLRGQDDNCDEIKDCFVKELLNKLSRKEQECEELKGIRDGNFLHALEEQKRADKLSKTLTEIKEFFNEECIICKENYINITGEICKECKYQDILKKINEVE